MILNTLNNKKNISSILPIEYLSNPDKFVYPFQIKEPNKIRTIITYNNIEQFGNKDKAIVEFIRKETDYWFDNNMDDCTD